MDFAEEPRQLSRALEQLRETECDLAETRRDLEVASMRIAELEGSQHDLFAQSSHELRTPLASILGYLEEVIEAPEGISSENLEDVRTAYRNARRLNALIDDLLTLDQLNTRTVEVRCELVDVVRLLEPVAADFEIICKRKGLHLFVGSVEPSIELMVDVTLTRRVLANLLNSALEHTAAPGRLAITYEVNGPLCEINVIDSGIGFPGTGLGLGVAHSLAVAQGGSLVGWSVEGVGTTFTLSVPIAMIPVGVI